MKRKIVALLLLVALALSGLTLSGCPKKKKAIETPPPAAPKAIDRAGAGEVNRVDPGSEVKPPPMRSASPPPPPPSISAPPPIPNVPPNVPVPRPRILGN
jgi:hypothetical protein